MKITWLGHACFKIEEDGFVVILDPYMPGTVPGYRDLRERADLVLCSHDHRDHCAREVIKKKLVPALNPFNISTFDSWHDDAEGTLRGTNKITLLEKDGIRIVHMGDIGCEPTDDVYAMIAAPDVLMIPAGGFFTAEPPVIKKMIDRLDPKTVIPMHFRTETFGYDKIGTVDALLNEVGMAEFREDSELEVDETMPYGMVVLDPLYAEKDAE